VGIIGGVTFCTTTFGANHRPVLLGLLSAAAVLLVGCNSSTTPKSTEPAAESPTASAESTAAPAPERVRAQGRVDGLAGSTVMMAAKEDPKRVAILPNTKVLQLTPGQLVDVKPGSCVNVRRAAPAADGAPGPATTITISEAAPNGICPEAIADNAVRGAVASVNGQTVSVSNTSQPEPTAVTVDPGTQYTRQASVSALAITPGACLSAVGTLDPGGVLQAASATIGPPVNGVCPGV
jgi:hypothetical protein